GHIDRADFGMGHGGTDEGEVEDAGQVEIVDVARPAEEDLRVLDPADGVAQQGSGGSHGRAGYGTGPATSTGVLLRRTGVAKERRLLRSLAGDGAVPLDHELRHRVDGKGHGKRPSPSPPRQVSGSFVP